MCIWLILPRWKVIELASLISTLILHYRGKYELPSTGYEYYIKPRFLIDN